MELVVPWSGFLALVRPHYAVAGNGRRPVGLEVMLRTYFVQRWFNLSDLGVEEALYESPVLQWFTGVELGAAPAPDKASIHRQAKGIKIATGTIVDATIIHAPSSTRNASGARDRRCTRRRRVTSGTSG